MFVLKRYLGRNADSYLRELSLVGMLALVVRMLRNPHDLSYAGGDLFSALYVGFALFWLVRQVTGQKKGGFGKFEGQAAVVAIFSALSSAFCFMLGQPGLAFFFLALSSAGYLASLLFDLKDRLNRKTRVGRDGKHTKPLA